MLRRAWLADGRILAVVDTLREPVAVAVAAVVEVKAAVVVGDAVAAAERSSTT